MTLSVRTESYAIHSNLSLQGLQHRHALPGQNKLNTEVTQPTQDNQSDSTRHTTSTRSHTNRNGLVAHHGQRAMNVESFRRVSAMLRQDPSRGVLRTARLRSLAMRDQFEARLVEHHARDHELVLPRWPVQQTHSITDLLAKDLGNAKLQIRNMSRSCP